MRQNMGAGSTFAKATGGQGRGTILTGIFRAHAKGTGFFGARFFRRAGCHGSTAGETPAAT